MRERHRGWGTAGGILVAVALFWLAGQFGRGVRLVAADRAPSAEGLWLRDLTGREVDLASFGNDVVLINLWAGWCPPCRAEIPRLNRLAADHRSAGLTVVGVNIEGVEPAQVAEMEDSLGIEYPVMVPRGAIPPTFGWDGTIPHLVLVDRAGRIRAIHSGLPSERSLRRALERLLGEPGVDQVPSSANSKPIPAIAVGAPPSSSSGP